MDGLLEVFTFASSPSDMVMETEKLRGNGRRMGRIWLFGR